MLKGFSFEVNVTVCLMQMNVCVCVFVGSEVNRKVPSARIYMFTVFGFSKCGGQQMFFTGMDAKKTC